MGRTQDMGGDTRLTSQDAARATVPTVEVEVWIVVDEGGDYALGTDQDHAVERFAEDVGGTLATRQVRVTVRVPLPRPVELVGEVSAEPEDAVLRAV